MTRLWVLVLLGWLVAGPARAELQRVRFEPLGGRELPVAFHSHDEPQSPRERLQLKDWALLLSGKTARISQQGGMLLAELEGGKKVWFRAQDTRALPLKALPGRRSERGKYWWNDLLQEYQARGLLLSLEDTSAVSMRFLARPTAVEVFQLFPEVLGGMGLFVEREADHPGLYQLRTETVQEETPGLFGPPYRRYSFLVNVAAHPAGAEVSIRATVTSWQNRSDYGYAWRPDESPGIRQRIRQSVAELLTRTYFPEDWRAQLSDFEAGYALPEVEF